MYGAATGRSLYPYSVASGRHPAQAMLSNKTNLLLHVTVKSKGLSQSGTARSRLHEMPSPCFAATLPGSGFHS